MFPACLASDSGIATRSSLHIGINSTENVNLKLFLAVWLSCEMSSDDFFTRTGTTEVRKSTNWELVSGRALKN